jgi:Fe-S-cluster containining protein
MKEKMDFSDSLKIRQDPWDDSPCSHCPEIYCCENLPLAPLRLNNQGDFINLILTSSYNGIFPVLKETGEWNFYLKRDCQFLSKPGGQCQIHQSADQSLICKSYDAHTCWYVKAFNTERFTTMIRFDTEMIIWFERKYKLIENAFDVDIHWDELCSAAYDYRLNTIDLRPDAFIPLASFRLPFKKSKSDQYLFLPPYKRPENRNHFELLSFRLGFPGVSLAITDNCWAFIIKTVLNMASLNLIRKNYYPAIEHKDGFFSFDSVMKEFSPYSDAGEQWVVLQRSDLKVLKDLTVFDSNGRVRKLPKSSEVLHALKPKHPGLVAS